MNQEIPVCLPERCAEVAWCVLVLVVQTAGLLAVVFVVLMGMVGVSDIIDSQLMAMDSASPERLRLLEEQYRREAWTGWAVPLLVAAGICGLFLWRMWRRVERIAAVLWGGR